MELWRLDSERAGDAGSRALAGLLGRATDAGCALTMRTLAPEELAARRTPPDPNDLRPGSPIILWDADNDPTLRVNALRQGIDDVVGPWMDAEEALARLMRLADRSAQLQARRGSRWMLGDLSIDWMARDASREGRALGLLGREYELLLHLARHRHQPQSRRMLLRAIWGIEFEPGTNVVEVQISRLRARLDRGFDWPMLRTVRGQGYRLVTAP